MVRVADCGQLLDSGTRLWRGNSIFLAEILFRLFGFVMVKVGMNALW